jgi:hypothetical protein
MMMPMFVPHSYWHAAFEAVASEKKTKAMQACARRTISATRF